MTWVKISATSSIVDSPGASVYFVYDPAVSASIKYRCAGSADADTLVAKLNSVDYP